MVEWQLTKKKTSEFMTWSECDTNITSKLLQEDKYSTVLDDGYKYEVSFYKDRYTVFRTKLGEGTDAGNKQDLLVKYVIYDEKPDKKKEETVSLLKAGDIEDIQVVAKAEISKARELLQKGYVLAGEYTGVDMDGMSRKLPSCQDFYKDGSIFLIKVKQ